MKSRLAVVLALVGAFLAGLLVGRWSGWLGSLDHLSRLLRELAPKARQAQQGRQLWTCPMHPQVVQDHPGDCPSCGMKLVPRAGAGPESAGRQETTAPASAGEEPQAGVQPGKQLWTCGMHPQVIQDHPGNCPICGMKLVPLKQAPLAGEHAAHQTAGTTPASKPVVRVSPSFLQNFAIRTAVAERGSIPLDLRTVGVLTYNDKAIVSISTKFEGWIEKAYVNYVGEPVKKGQVLFEVYSPELVTTQQEYLAALEYVHRLEQGGAPEAIERGRALVAAAEERLKYWDITPDQIQALRRNRQITRTLKIVSPVSGIVVAKMDRGLEGMKLTPGMSVFKIADLSTVWARIELYESQLAHVQPGTRARVKVNAFPERQWVGKIIYIDPAVDPKTRTLTAYLEIPNPGWKLRPEMYADVEILAPAVQGAVRVPEEAVLHTGERHVVIVQREPGVFEPREVQVGAIGGGYQQIRSGLKPGEIVVTSSQFLIDSESNLREAIAKMLAGRQQAGQGEAATPPATHQH